MIIVESKRKKPATILKKYPDAILADVTSGAKDGLIKLSPFYPHGGIPVPFSEGYTATCVEEFLSQCIKHVLSASNIFDNFAKEEPSKLWMFKTHLGESTFCNNLY